MPVVRDGERPVHRLRLVTPDGDVELGKAVVRLESGPPIGPKMLTTWAPKLDSDLDEADRAAALNAFAAWVAELADSIGADVVETTPADDVENLALWLAALSNAGFNEVAAAHVLVANLPADTTAAELPIGSLTLNEVGVPEMRALERLIERVHGSTEDRIDVVDRRPGAYVLASLAANTVAIPSAQLWLVARNCAGPVGYVFGSIDQDETVWVVDIGVDPPHRRRGIGRWMLQTMLHRATGAPKAYALVDDSNRSSRNLHLGAGFAEEPTTYRTWRRWRAR